MNKIFTLFIFLKFIISVNTGTFFKNLLKLVFSELNIQGGSKGQGKTKFVYFQIELSVYYFHYFNNVG